MRLTMFFIAALLGLASQSLAQAPGGVKSPEVWFGTYPTTSNLQGTYFWKDLSGDSVRNLLYDTRASKYGVEFSQSRNSFITLNFNPSLNLSAQHSPKEALLRFSNLSQATIIGVFMPRPSTIGTDATLCSVEGADGDSVLLSKDKVVRVDGRDIDFGKDFGEDLLYSSQDKNSEEAFRATAPRILTYMKASHPNHSVWGVPQETKITTGAIHNSTDKSGGTSYDETLMGSPAFDGYVPELIAYGRTLSPIERRKVETYLAIKYGITLENSYIDSSGNLVWDANANSHFHHRVTGIMCDSTNNFYQPLSVSSYEALPFSSIDHDSFEKANSYGLPTSNRLLVMGYPEYARLHDGFYMIWGDNDGDLGFSASKSDPELLMMNRKWLVQSNIVTSPTTRNKSSDEVPFIKKSSFLSLRLQSNMDQEDWYQGLYDYTPLIQSEGGYQWTYRQQGVETIVKFGTPDFDFASGDYGYKIDAHGKVFAIQNGTIGTASFHQLSNGDRIKVVKTDHSLFLRINGLRTSHEHDISILPAYHNIACYPSIVFGKNSSLVNVDSIEILGRSPERGYVELSYLHPQTKILKTLPTQQIFLAIDNSGKGTFLPEDIQLYPCQYKDSNRSKLIFSNIPFASQGTARCHFTFCYATSPLSLSIKTTNPTCSQGVEGVDGDVSVRILSGNPYFDYLLYKTSSEGDSLVQSLSSTDSTVVMGGLSSGEYTLKIRQGGGLTYDSRFELEAITTDHSTEQGGVSWRVGTIPTRFGLVYAVSASTPLQTRRAKRHVFPKVNGIYFDGDRLYALKKGDIDPYPHSYIKPGDPLTVKIEDGKIICTQRNTNVVVIYLDQPGPYRLCMSTYNTILHNIQLSGFPTETSWDCNKPSNFITCKETERTYHFTLSSPCNDAPSSHRMSRTALPSDLQIQPSLVFSVRKEDGKQHYKASLQQGRVTDATLMVFNASGNLIVEKPMVGGDEKTAYFELPTKGVYIVKAMTSDKEFTEKLLAQ